MWQVVKSCYLPYTPCMSRNHRQLSGRRWERTRRLVFRRDGYRCTSCGRAGRLEAHHTHRLRDGGDLYDIVTITTTCRSCHIAIHKPDDVLPGRAEWLDYLKKLV